MNGEKSSEKVTSEIWKPIKGYEGHYEISNLGRVKTVERVAYQKHWQGGQSRYVHKEMMRKPHKRNNGYLCVTLRKGGAQKTFNIHRLVALHFIPRVEGKDYVNHIDSNKENNRVDNLEWCTQSENILHGYRYGNKIPPHQRKVAQYDMDGNLVKIWDSEAEPQKVMRVYQANIYKVCRGKRKQAGGYIWRYIE